VTEPTPPQLANRCFVCGPTNPIGLQLKFRIEDDRCVAEFTPDENHVGYPGVVHGGILFSALDDVMANWLYLQGDRAYTVRCDVRFNAAAAVGGELRLEGREVKRRRRVVVMAGEAIRPTDGTVVAEAEGRFMIINKQEFAPASTT